MIIMRWMEEGFLIICEDCFMYDLGETPATVHYDAPDGEVHLCEQCEEKRRTAAEPKPE